MLHVDLTELAGGTLQEKFDQEIMWVIENMQDPNTPFREKRSITINISFHQGERRDDAKVEISVKSKLASVMVEDKTVANYGNDGVSQKNKIKTSFANFANVENVIVPNLVKLRSFTTFHEIEQPELKFVFRMRNGFGGVSCALLEADGGTWEFRTVHSIAEYWKKEMKGVADIAILS